MMNSRNIAGVLVGLSAVAVVSGWFFSNHPESGVVHKQDAPRTRQSGMSSSVPARSQDATDPGSAADGGRKLLSKEEIAVYLEDASTRYDDTSVPLISPYLDHPDPEVRKAAVNAMLVSGRAAAAGPLRSASKLLTDPREAVSYLEAADYLELPSHTPKLRKKR